MAATCNISLIGAHGREEYMISIVDIGFNTMEVFKWDYVERMCRHYNPGTKTEKSVSGTVVFGTVQNVGNFWRCLTGSNETYLSHRDWAESVLTRLRVNGIVRTNRTESVSDILDRMEASQ